MHIPKSVATICVLTILLGTVQAARGDVLRGEVVFSSSVLLGETSAASSAVAALHFSSDTSNLEGSWTLRADEVLVNWTRMQRTGAGASPNDPNESLANTGPPERRYGETSYHNASLASAINALGANLLVLPGTATLDVDYTGELRSQPADAEKWASGPFSNHTVAAFDDPMIKSYATRAGDGIFRSTQGFRGTLHGDVVLYAWGANITVDQPGEPSQSFRSGSWHENATATQAGPRGLVRTDYRQLVRIEASDATLHFTHHGGLGQWAASDARTATNGTALWERASGRLQTGSDVYTSREERIRIDGAIAQTLHRDPGSPDRLSSRVTASAASINLIPNAAPAPTSASSVVGWMTSLVLLIALAALAAVWWKRESPVRQLKMIDQMSDLLGKDPAKVERKLRRRVRRDPHDREARILYAQSVLELGRNKELLRQFEPVLRRSSQPEPALAYILAKASARLKRAAKTIELIEEATQEPVLREQILQDVELQPFLATQRRRPPTREPVTMGYA